MWGQYHSIKYISRPKKYYMQVKIQVHIQEK